MKDKLWVWRLLKWKKEIPHCQMSQKLQKTIHMFRKYFHLYTGLSWLAVTRCDLSHYVRSKLLRLVVGNSLAASVSFRTNAFKEPQPARRQTWQYHHNSKEIPA